MFFSYIKKNLNESLLFLKNNEKKNKKKNVWIIVANATLTPENCSSKIYSFER